MLSPEILTMLLDAGFEKWNLSLATIDAGSQARKTDTGAYLAAAAAIAGRGLPLVSYFIAGLPGDTPETVIRHLFFLKQAPTIFGISLFYPVPGIQGFNPPPPLLRQSPGLARGSFAYPWTGALDAGQLVTAFRLARLVNLMKKHEHTREEKELLERCFVERRLFTLRQEAGKRSAEGKAGLRIAPVPADGEMVGMFLGD